MFPTAQILGGGSLDLSLPVSEAGADAMARVEWPCGES